MCTKINTLRGTNQGCVPRRHHRYHNRYSRRSWSPNELEQRRLGIYSFSTSARVDASRIPASLSEKDAQPS